jgi:hypothetical protein
MDNILSKLFTKKTQTDNTVFVDVHRIKLINAKVEEMGKPKFVVPIKDGFFTRMYKKFKALFTKKPVKLTLNTFKIDTDLVKPFGDNVLANRERLAELMTWKPKQHMTFDDAFYNAELQKSITDATWCGPSSPRHVDFDIIEDHNWLNKGVDNGNTIQKVMRADYDKSKEDLDYQWRKLNYDEPFAVSPKKEQVKSTVDKDSYETIDKTIVFKGLPEEIKMLMLGHPIK